MYWFKFWGPAQSELERHDRQRETEAGKILRLILIPSVRLGEVQLQKELTAKGLRSQRLWKRPLLMRPLWRSGRPSRPSPLDSMPREAKVACPTGCILAFGFCPLAGLRRLDRRRQWLGLGGFAILMEWTR